MIQLRDYQAAGVRALGLALRQPIRAALYVAPTGSGKTRVLAYLASALTASPGRAGRRRRVLCLVHRRELRAQLCAALADAGLEHGVIAPGYPWVARPVQVASVFALAERLARLDAWGWAPDYVFVDEAHHCIPGSTWGAVLAHWPRARVVGLTATPLRLDGAALGTAGGGYFEALVEGPTIADLTAGGHLARVDLHVPGRIVDASAVRQRGGDYVRAELAALVNRPQITGDAIAHYRALADQRPAIAFCATVAHSETVAEDFRRAGYRWASVNGGLRTAERVRRLADLASGGLHGISTCSLVEEGVDIPVAAVAINLAHTLSLSRRMQRVGRIMRPALGKGAALELDHVGVSLRHGAAAAPRSWSLDQEPPAPVEAPGAPTALVDRPARGRRIAPAVKPGHLVAAELGADGQLRPSARQLAWDLDAMRTLERTGGYPPGWADAVHRARAAA